MLGFNHLGLGKRGLMKKALGGGRSKVFELSWNLVRMAQARIETLALRIATLTASPLIRISTPIVTP